MAAVSATGAGACGEEMRRGPHRGCVGTVAAWVEGGTGTSSASRRQAGGVESARRDEAEELRSWRRTKTGGEAPWTECARSSGKTTR